MDEKYFKGKCQSYINCANRTLAGLIQNLFGNHGTVSPVNIE